MKQNRKKLDADSNKTRPLRKTETKTKHPLGGGEELFQPDELRGKLQAKSISIEKAVLESVERPEAKKHVPAKELPERYGDNHIYLMVRDPHWVFAYWEIQRDHQERVLGQLGGSWDEVRSILRVYDTTNPTGSSFFDVTLQNVAASWYIQVEPNRRYVVEIGLLHEDGRFLPLARSNEVLTPRAGMSEVVDEEWMGIDFDKMYALSGGFELGKSSMDLRRLMEERLAGAISSGSGIGVVSSTASPVKIRKRGFWFVLDCELILYGATEPDATVTLQGKPVKLRPDGTFALRFAFPDGKLVLDTHAFSSDGIEERIITPMVERRTERPAPILAPKAEKPEAALPVPR